MWFMEINGQRSHFATKAELVEALELRFEGGLLERLMDGLDGITIEFFGRIIVIGHY